MPFNVDGKSTKIAEPPSYGNEKAIALIDAKADDLAAVMRHGRDSVPMRAAIIELRQVVQRAKACILMEND